MNVFWLLVHKDLRAEFRRPEAVVSMVFFGFLLLVLLNTALPPGAALTAESGAGVLWVAISFAAVLGLGKTMSRERENRCIDGLLLSPVSAETLFAAKLAANFVLIAASELPIVPLFFVLYGDGFLQAPVALTGVILLANAGMAATGTLFSMLTAGTTRNEALLPLLFYPVVMPLLAITVRVTGMVFQGEPAAQYASWLSVMGGYALLFTGGGTLLVRPLLRQ